MTAREKELKRLTKDELVKKVIELEKDDLTYDEWYYKYSDYAHRFLTEKMNNFNIYD